MSEAIDPDIHAAATWLAEQQYDPRDEFSNARRSDLVEYRYWQIVEKLRTSRYCAQPKPSKIGMSVPCSMAKGDIFLRVATVSVYDDHRVYGYLPRGQFDDLWPDFVWPHEEAERLKRKRAEAEEKAKASS